MAPTALGRWSPPVVRFILSGSKMGFYQNLQAVRSAVGYVETITQSVVLQHGSVVFSLVYCSDYCSDQS